MFPIMKKIIILSVLICINVFAICAQRFEITNQNTLSHIISEGKPQRFLISPFAICVYDSIEYFVYHNWFHKNDNNIISFEYTSTFNAKNTTSQEEKETRCKKLQTSSYIAIVELADSITKASVSYNNDTLILFFKIGYPFSNTIEKEISIKAKNKNLRHYYGYGGIAGKDKKPVVILYE